MATSWLANAIEMAIAENKGLAVGKLGTCESDTLYLFNKQHPYNWVTRLAMTRNAGLWPDENKTLHSWSAYMATHVLPHMDGVAMWWNEEHEGTIFRAYAPQAHIQEEIEWFEPWRQGHEWTRAIPAGCRVAVVTPFVESLAAQAPLVNKLFDRPLWQDPLPEFIPIKTGCSPVFDSTSDAAWSESIRSGGWLKAVSHIVKEVVAANARVAIVGCGALSLSIVTALKQRGIIAIHTGGVTQMIFGIRGQRWIEDPKFTHLCKGEHWTNPRPSETPLHANTIERGCYWVKDAT
jgi:hypothetical protein